MLACVMLTESRMQNRMLWLKLQLSQLLLECINEILLWDYLYKMEDPKKTEGKIDIGRLCLRKQVLQLQ